ncbi:hypothetical protein Sa4125_16570 [Aureimonas sp. SA4125]|uniref:PepSY-associated TM helix domain-containing protein n=1 Tax=Aureimonas sp. SA4125 TaxID=2826993 RepID=UPI001CC4155E|nr:PepSY domain-containing protein [Aureimonas sp. SA4125]BDA84115.1 hypothetical protein Sa4125_16570 [Aureimonas sp. SA4125]
MTELSLSEGRLRASSVNDAYRAIWRWHFYAGLIAIPFMIVLAVTGSLYLFRDEIDNTFYASRNVVAEQEGLGAPASALVSRAEAAIPGGKAIAFRDPARPDQSARVTLSTDAGTTYVFLDPHDATVLGSVLKVETLNEVVRKIHSLEYFGVYANRVMEAIAGFAIILVVTGLYLWWPRRRGGGVVTVRGVPRQRVFWRDLHAVTGAFSGILIAFLAISGLPWSTVWGGQLTAITTATGTGYPAALWDSVPVSDEHAAHAMETTAWTLETSPMPMSQMPGMAGAGMPAAGLLVPAAAPQPIGLDAALAIARTAGISRGFEMSLPADATGVYTAAIFPDALDKQRTIHIDQFSGKPIVDIAYADYGSVAKAVELGVNIHMGQEFGLANQLLMLATCLAIILVSVAAVVMWLKRRPAGRLGVPPYPASRSVYPMLWAMVVVLGIAFPLSGALIIAMLAIDLILVRRIPWLRQRMA